MTAPNPIQAQPMRLPDRLHALASMADLLQRLELQPRSASAEQYRLVAQQVARLLAEAEPDHYLYALLAAAPAAAELYENMRYDLAGLCCTPLQRALDAELAATAALTKARHRGDGHNGGNDSNDSNDSTNNKNGANGAEGGQPPER